jgi:exonuclease III
MEASMRLSLAALVMASLLPAVQAEAESIRLAAWNINNLNDVAGVALRDRAPIRAEGDYVLLNDYRERLDPDVIALQEMGNPKAAARIFPPDQYEVIFEGRFQPDQPGDVYTALAVRKNKVRIIEKGDFEPLSVIHEADNRPVRRGVQALLEVAGDRFWVMSVHLKSGCFAKSLKPPSASQTDCKTLAKQMAPLEQWIDEKESTGLPVIIMGDFNRKFDVHGQSDHLWAEVDDGQPSPLNLWRLPFRTASECPTTRESDREFPIDFLVFNEKAWPGVDQQSFFELLYDDEDVSLGDRLSDHCPHAVDFTPGQH